jgi:hypothetical protein
MISVGVLISAGSYHGVLGKSTNTDIASSPHCDQSGYPSCRDVGFANGKANPGTPCPSGHSANYCSGWNNGAKNGTTTVSTNIASSPHCDQSGYPSCRDVGAAAAKANPGAPCPPLSSKA